MLVVGAGEISTLTAQHLRSAGRRRDRRSPAARRRTPRRWPPRSAAARVAVGASWRTALAGADIVVTATGSQRPIITRAQVEAVTGRHRRDPLFIIDIAVPRDVEAVGRRHRAGVPLQRRRPADDRAGEPVAAQRGDRARRGDRRRGSWRKFAAWQRSRGAVPTVVALRQRFDAIRRSELQRLDGKLAGLPPEARARVDEVTRLIVEKLLLEPTEQLKALPDEETQVAYTEAVNRLFRLRDGESLSSGDETSRGRASRPARQVAGSSTCARTRELDSQDRHPRQPARAVSGQRRRGAASRARRDAPARSSSSRRRATGWPTRRCRRSAASGCS